MGFSINQIFMSQASEAEKAEMMKARDEAANKTSYFNNGKISAPPKSDENEQVSVEFEDEQPISPELQEALDVAKNGVTFYGNGLASGSAAEIANTEKLLNAKQTIEAAIADPNYSGSVSKADLQAGLKALNGTIEEHKQIHDEQANKEMMYFKTE